MKLKAHAKINLGLAVTHKRQDGFHDLDTLFARIDLHDELNLEPIASGIQLEVLGADLAADKTNLVYKAAELYLKQARIDAGIAMSLLKRIPLSAGLGGGSSDAAAVLKGLSKLYPAKLNLAELALDLGSDVPFFLSDSSAAHATGRGEKLRQLSLAKRYVVLIKPQLAISAKEAYVNLKKLAEPLNLKAILEALEHHKEPPYLNSLAPAMLEHYPELVTIVQSLKALGLQGALMSGSGSTCFALAANQAEALEAVSKLKQENSNYWVQASFFC